MVSFDDPLNLSSTTEYFFSVTEIFGLFSNIISLSFILNLSRPMLYTNFMLFCFTCSGFILFPFKSVLLVPMNVIVPVPSEVVL